MAAKLLAQLRRQWIGVIALFVAVSGGVASATHPGGADTISSADIIDNTVRTDDIRDANLRTADIDTNAIISNKIADGGIQNVDVANDTLTGAKVADGSLDGVDIEDNAVNSAKVADGSLTDADTSGLVPYTDVFWAVVNSNGTLVRASSATTTSVLEAAGTGDYEVDFGFGTRSLDACASVAQISESGFVFDELPGQAASAPGETLSRAIDVRTFNSTGTAADRAFTVHVLCPEEGGGAAFAKSADRGHR